MGEELQIERLEEANQQLQESLKHCRELVSEYRAKFAANGNEPLLLNERDGDDGEAVSY